MAHEDKVSLNGQDYLIVGPVLGKPVAEFEAGLKVGRATYDQREHAFFEVMDDFSGGFAVRVMDIREEVGTFWESLDTNAPDLSRARHMTLPGVITSRSVSANPTQVSHYVAPGDYPWDTASDGSYIFGIGNSIYSTSDGVTFTRRDAGGADAGTVGSLTHLTGSDGVTLWFACYTSIALAGTGTARYKVSTDGLTWVNGATNKVLPHAFVWDGKIIAEWQAGLIFGIVSGGAETWNIDDPLDGEYLGFPGGFPFFIGVAQAPWGEPAVYFHNGKFLWVLDFFARKIYPIDTGIGRSIHDAKLWNGDIIMTDGWNCFAYSTSGQTVRNIGFPMKDGIPPTMNNATQGIARLRFLMASDNHLYACVGKRPTPTTGTPLNYLWKFNGQGWQQLAGEMNPMEPFGLFQANFTQAGSGLLTDRKIIMFGAADYNSLTPKVFTYDLPDYTQIPVVGIDTFGPSGAQWITSWRDGGFLELDGAALRLMMDGFSLSTTSTVKVEYQLDNAETSAWVQMVDSANVADVFDDTTRTLYFSSATPLRGIKFRTVRFRFTLNRGSTATDSPEVKAFVFVYLKKPQLRQGWTFTIDVNRMIAEGTLVGGAAATLSNVWSALKTAWNTKPLIDFDIPNVQSNMDVIISDMPITFDDFRDAVDGRGTIIVTVLEPVAA